MVTITNYNPQSMAYEVGPSERDYKLANICSLNEIQIALNKGPLTPEQFESFLGRDLRELDQMVFDNSALLERIINNKLNPPHHDQ
jgi:hypothetical protein